ncbi:hypothetical protein ED208_04430 [Stagnimonas aquatica]|uniref:Uncharacterized protein n=1 Tax=Stagnimonas aquatica TaxID=2689987 RepID=A0A3N0VM01_9GAMM|nr:hypothetical protein [Stagnimonas aquatica]ROH93775.1 hypothetical protein ED208_04430 [Stagnimonas aquatica]
MTAAKILEGLADGSLPPSEFGHAAHLRVARELLLHAPLAEAEARFCTLIEGYVRHLGAEAKFHRTLSIALLRLTAARLRPGESWAQFQAANPDLFANARGLLARHYSAECLAAGRTQFTPPDLLPLPA